MANFIYDKARNAWLTGDISWTANNFFVYLIDTGGYQATGSVHEFLSSIPAAARVATGVLANRTADSGVADANDLTFSGVSGPSIEALVIAKSGATDSVSRLIAYIDTATAGLPLTPNGGDITVSWSNGASKIFKL